MGTPPPSAHQLLQPTLSYSLLPLPSYLPVVYSLVSSIHEYSAAVTALRQLRHTHANLEEKLTTCIERLSDWKVSILMIIKVTRIVLFLFQNLI